MESTKSDSELSSVQADRRAFLASAGKFAVGVPPALVVLLSTSMNSSAIAASSGTTGLGPTPKPPSYGEVWRRRGSRNTEGTNLGGNRGGG